MAAVIQRVNWPSPTAADRSQLQLPPLSPMGLLSSLVPALALAVLPVAVLLCGVPAAVAAHVAAPQLQSAVTPAGGQLGDSRAIARARAAMVEPVHDYPRAPPHLHATGVAGALGDVLHARDFGVIADGVTDDTAALQRAIDSASGTQVVLLLPVPWS